MLGTLVFKTVFEYLVFLKCLLFTQIHDNNLDTVPFTLRIYVKKNLTMEVLDVLCCLHRIFLKEFLEIILKAEARFEPITLMAQMLKNLPAMWET